MKKMNETKTKKGKRKEERTKERKEARKLPTMIKNVSIEACPCVSIVEFKKGRLRPGMVVYAFNFWEAEAGGAL